MKVLVTGGAGFIGSVTVEKLILSGHDVVVFDNLLYGNLGAIHPKAKFQMGDLADERAIYETLNKTRPDAIMHFAAHSLVGESMDKPFLYLDTNVRNAMNLIKLSFDYGVRKFIFSSSANVFGHSATSPISEDTPINPSTPYGEGKYLIERMLHWYAKTTDLQYVALRYFNAAGASENYGEWRKKETHLIPRALTVAEGKGHLSVFGTNYQTKDGTCIRDYVHVLDLADAHILALENINHCSSAYNLGNGNGHSVYEVLRTIEEVTGIIIPVMKKDRRAGDPAILIANYDKIKNELGWQPKYNLHDTIQSAWEWRQNHPMGYGK